MSPNDADGVANSVDPDQTAPSSLIWVCTVCPRISVRKLRIITITEITAGDAINKETRISHVGLCLGGTSGTIL